MSKRKKSIYIVIKGYQPGVYSEWEGYAGAKPQVEGFIGSVYKGFFTAEEAYNWLKSQPAQLLSPSHQKWLAEQKDEQGSSLNKRIEDHLQSGGVVIFTDGSTLGNPGRGGFGAVIIDQHGRRELSGGFRLTTNNRMELYACIAALEGLEPPSRVLLITDSAYIHRATSEGWLQKWSKNHWQRGDAQPVMNADLWQRLFVLCQQFSVEFYWIKGHNANQENERCDQLASSAAKDRSLPEDQGYRMRHPTLKERQANTQRL